MSVEGNSFNRELVQYLRMVGGTALAVFKRTEMTFNGTGNYLPG